VNYNRKKLWWIRLIFWCCQLPVLAVLYRMEASTNQLVWYGLLISVLTGIEACLPSKTE
jgi:hypothetical protein